MTVAELIAALSELPQELPVKIDYDFGSDVIGPEILVCPYETNDVRTGDKIVNITVA